MIFLFINNFLKNRLTTKALAVLLFSAAVLLTGNFLITGVFYKTEEISVQNDDYKELQTNETLSEPLVSDFNKKNGGDLSLNNEQKTENNFSSEAGNQKANVKAAMSIKIVSGEENILFKKDKSKKLPIASLTKLMTALIVLENYDLNEEITISANAIMEEGGKNNFKDGEVFSVRNLLYAILVESSNKAAYAMGEKIGIENFIDLMNIKAAELEMTNTHFSDNTGLSSDSYSTAEDIVKISKHLFENYPLFKEITAIKEYDLYLSDGSFHHKVVNTNKMLGEMNIVGGKTGWTIEARGCFMAIQKNPGNSNYFIYVVLGVEDRFAEMGKLINGNIEYSSQNSE